MDEAIEIQLSRLVIQDRAESQFIHLRERDGDRWFPIVIGFNEAWEIQSKLLNYRTRRPMTHDLIGAILARLDCVVARVVINDLREDTFFAELVLRSEDGEERAVDCRPSDAIAVAVQVGAPMFVVPEVFESVAQ